MSERRVINGEPCELVERFEDLRASDIIYATDCGWCDGGVHRGITVSTGVFMVEGSDEVIQRERVWDFLPVASCGVSCVAADTVLEGVVWRVVFDLGADVTRTRERELAE